MTVYDKRSFRASQSLPNSTETLSDSSSVTLFLTELRSTLLLKLSEQTIICLWAGIWQVQSGGWALLQVLGKHRERRKEFLPGAKWFRLYLCYLHLNIIENNLFDSLNEGLMTLGDQDRDLRIL